MTTTLAATVKNVRRLLQDEPLSDVLAAAVTTAGQTTMTVTDVTKHAVGTWWEFDDDTGDVVLETALDPTTSVATVRRGYLGSTAATHLNAAVILKQPRFKYDLVSQAINTVLDADLFGEGLFELVEHQVTSNAAGSTGISTLYNSPSASCERFLDVYQKTSSMQEPTRDDIIYSEFPRNVDTTLFAAGKYFTIEGNHGVAGTDLYYVTCAHKLAITTITASQERIVHNLAAAYLLEWTEPRRTAGPTNQGDRTVRTGAALPTAAYFRQVAEEQMQKERRYIKSYTPEKRRFVRNS